MKKTLAVLFLALLVASPLYAATWCGWSGTEGINCRSDTAGWIQLPNGLLIAVDEANFNRHGYYRLETTEPTIGANQVKDETVWSFADNVISKTWTVRDLTATEIDQRVASPLSVNDYWQWKAIQLAGGWTNQQMLNALPADLVEAFQARARLLED